MTERLPRGIDAMLRWLLPGDLTDPIAGDLLEEFIDVHHWRGSARAVAGTVGASLLVGSVPASAASSDRTAAALAESGRSTTAGTTTRRLRAALVVGELALSLMLLVGAALLIVSFRKLVDVPTGFRSQHLVTMRVTLPQATYAQAPPVVRFYNALLERIVAAPGVESAGVVTMMPFGGLDSHSGFLIERRMIEFPFPVRVRPLSVTSRRDPADGRSGRGVNRRHASTCGCWRRSPSSPSR